ncbi:MAG: type II toxin-antitoxin system death-on-curing family toxin [Endomicrobiales bacterium]|nr:type II toxin-antitoxin system death-on-curing family toxin [Endomicrobiales bacterium]
MKKITIKEVELLAHKLAQEHLSFDEPIPDFTTRFPNVLERCLFAPYQTFDGKYLYRGLVEKASILFYVMIKDHPFQNGNKRIAVTTLLTFLYVNEYWLETDNQVLYNFAIWVASSPREATSGHVVAGIGAFIKKYIVELKHG